ncbi:MAG: tetratricopeptide repeat protein [Candidatus Hodarchaeales archaeon]|jgi:tetratricopeptide (TPR) repeat protein
MLDDNTITSEYSFLIQSLCKISEFYLFNGKLADAIDLLNNCSYLISRSEVQTEDQLIFLLQSGKLLVRNIFMHNGEIDRAIDELKRAETLDYLSNDNSKAKILDLKGLAHYNYQLHKRPVDFTKALDYFEEALKLQDNNDTRFLSEILFHIGLVNEQSGKTDDAWEFYQQAHDKAKENGHELEQSFAARHIGFLHQQKGNLEEATKSFEESLSLREKVGFKISLPFAYLSLGDIYIARNDLDKADEYCTRGYEAAIEMNNVKAKVLATYYLGKLFKKKEDWKRARQHLEEARDIATRINLQDLLPEIEKEIISIE